MNCRESKKYIYQMLDGEIPDSVKARLTPHLEGCSACQGELESIKTFQGILRSHLFTIEPSKDFERVFWQKALERQKEPWFARLSKDFESLIPAFNTKQAVGFALLAFFIGNIGGITSTIGQGALTAAPPASIRYLSSLQEFKGISPYSLTASYLKATEKEDSE